MNRTLKNILMITVIMVLFLCTSLTIYNEVKCSNSCSLNEYNNKVFDSQPKNIPSDKNIYNIKPTPQGDLLNDNESNAFRYRDETEDSARYKNFPNGEEVNPKTYKLSSNKSSIRISTIILLIIQSIGISLTTMYLIVSKFNKDSFKKTFDKTNNKIIFSICSIVIMIVLVVINIVITNVLL